MEHLEGRQSILAALHARQRRFELILVRHDAHTEKVRDVLDLAGQLSVPVKRVCGDELDELAHGSTHGGVLAIVSEKPRTTPADLMRLLDSLQTPPLLLLLEGIDDARNLGFVLRSADALGAHGVLIKKHLWDFDPIEVARPASGAYERLPLVQLEEIEPLIQLQRRGLKLFGCVAGAKRRMHDVDLRAPSILAIGGEKRGLSGAVRGIVDRFIAIPTRSGASLSMSHASAILLAEAARQRASPPARNASGAPDSSNFIDSADQSPEP
jgi:23S rRNA (guanosine2251-2'-O)-methyltransferase